MKNKDIKNKPQKYGRWLFLHSRFSIRGFQGRTLKGNTSIKPSESFFNNNNNNNKKKEPESPPPIKTIYQKFIFRLYRNWKKEEGAGERSFLCDL